MDIESLYTVVAHEAGAEVRIRNPLTGKLTDIYIKVVGVDSKVYRKAKHKAMRAAAIAMDENGELDDDDLACEILADATIGWRGMQSKGKSLPFSKKRAKDIYLNSPSIRDQVDAFTSKRANFTSG